jgi:Ca2+-binding RTX toxin-like protein
VVDLGGAADTARRGSEADTLTGIEGAVGSSAADRFTGDGGRNFFQGGAGKDTYTLGDGRDVVDLDRAAHSGPTSGARDVVADFAHLVDDLDLAGIDADATAAGDQAFRFVGTAALTGAGQVGYFTSGGNTVVRASTDADGAAELQVQLNGLVSLTVDDLYL